MFKRKRKTEFTEEQVAEFYRKLDRYNAAIARLPANWRDVAEGKAKLPATWDEYMASCGDALAGERETTQ